MITRDNFQQILTAAGFTLSKCGVCGLPKYKVFWPGLNSVMIEIRPTQTQFGTYVIYKHNAVAASGYLYDLEKNIKAFFPKANV